MARRAHVSRKRTSVHQNQKWEQRNGALTIENDFITAYVLHLFTIHDNASWITNSPSIIYHTKRNKCLWVNFLNRLGVKKGLDIESNDF